LFYILQILRGAAPWGDAGFICFYKYYRGAAPKTGKSIKN